MMANTMTSYVVSDETIKTLAETAYYTYNVNSVDVVSRRTWSSLTADERSRWIAVAGAVVAEAVERSRSTFPAMCDCGHAMHFHDIGEADGSGTRCCMTGCSCESTS